MKSLCIIILSFCLGIPLLAQEQDFYSLKAQTIQGKTFSFEQLRGKKVLIVNTATRCSLSPQLKTLQKMHEKYADSGLIILAFPANNFANREPGHDGQIQETCNKRFGISYQLMEKSDVIGPKTNEVFLWLTEKSKNGQDDYTIKWNYQKFLIDEKGKIFKVLDPVKKPNGKAVIEWIEG